MQSPKLVIYLINFFSFPSVLVHLAMRELETATADSLLVDSS